MLRWTRQAVLLLVLSAAIDQPAAAHHSFAGQYDAAKPITLTGTITKVEWTNPHAFFTIDVQGERGAMTSWELELGSPNMLIRYRITRETLRIGETVTAEGFLARDGSRLANAKTIRFADGRVLNAASSADRETTDNEGAQ